MRNIVYSKEKWGINLGKSEKSPIFAPDKPISYGKEIKRQLETIGYKV